MTTNRPRAQDPSPPTTGWHLGPLAGFDIELTGADPEDARMVQTAITRRGWPHTEEGAGPAATTTGDTVWLINPGVEIPPEAQKIHGISTAQTRDWMDPAKATAQIREAVADLLARKVPLVIFNARYDLTVLDRECRRHGVEPLVLDVERHLIIDPFILDKLLDKYRPGSRKLEDQCRHYSVNINGAHEAGADALAAMRVGWRIAHTHGRIANYSVAALMHLQAAAAKEQGTSLAAHFRKQGEPKPVGLDWPVVPWPEADRHYA